MWCTLLAICLLPLVAEGNCMYVLTFGLLPTDVMNYHLPGVQIAEL